MTDNLKLFIELNIAQIDKGQDVSVRGPSSANEGPRTETSCPYIYLCYIKLNKKFQVMNLFLYSLCSGFSLWEDNESTLGNTNAVTILSCLKVHYITHLSW